MAQTTYHPDSVAGMFADRADDWKSAEPFHAEVKVDRDTTMNVETDCDGSVLVFIHRTGWHSCVYLTAAQAGELETALYRAREHLGGC
jgi:xanthine/CO dehydrogenase XdhC/CoxF family maturation factor